MSTDYTQPPEGDALKNWVLGTGLLEEPLSGAAALLDFDGMMAGVIAEWNKDTGYSAGFAPGVAQTRKYHSWQVTRGVLRLGCGVYSVSEFRMNGTARVEGQDYILNDVNAASESKPFKSITLLPRLWYSGAWSNFGANLFELDGTFGYAAEWPPQVYNLLIQKAARRMFPQLGLQISGGLSALKADDVSLQFSRSSGGRAAASGPLSQEADTIDQLYRQMVLRFRYSV